MIVGTVRPNGDPVVSITIRGPAGTMEVAAVIDTGFSDYLALPSKFIAALGLPVVNEGRMLLADGSLAETKVHLATVEWLGRDVDATVTEVGGGALIGMSLMLECRLEIDVIPNGRIVIKRLA